jgi:Tol biopolymer transport system component
MKLLLWIWYCITAICLIMIVACSQTADTDELPTLAVLPTLTASDTPTKTLTNTPSPTVTQSPMPITSTPRNNLPLTPQIAYSQWQDGDYELMLLDITNGAIYQITNNKYNDIDPAWSPDGNQLVFAADMDGVYEIFSIHLDGTNLKRLTNNNLYSSQPEWSPDGNQIVFTVSQRDHRESIFFNETIDIYIMNFDGTNMRKLTDGNQRYTEPTWSPDSQEIAYRTEWGWESDIWAMKSDGTDQRQITERGDENSSPNWSPDGSSIIFLSDYTGLNFEASSMSIFRVTSGGGIQSPLWGGFDGPNNPVWSPDGTQITFDMEGAIFTVSSSGNYLRQLTEFPNESRGTAENPSWRPVQINEIAKTLNTLPTFTPPNYIPPSETPTPIPPTATPNTPLELVFIALTYREIERNTLFLSDISGDNIQKLHAEMEYDFNSPSWSPDGRQIAVMYNHDIYIMDANGDNMRNLTNSPAEQDASPYWSPDGRKILFSNALGITIVDVNGNNLTRLLPGVGAKWSPDGQKIVYAVGRPLEQAEIYVIDANCPQLPGGCVANARNLTQSDGRDSQPDWSPDGQHIVYTFIDDTGNDEIYIMNADGSNQIRLTYSDRIDSYPTWSPDGQRIVFTSAREGDEIFGLYIMDRFGNNITRIIDFPSVAADWRMVP